MLSLKHFKALLLVTTLVTGSSLKANPVGHIVPTPAPPPAMLMTGLSIDPGFIISMYNQAVQTPNMIVNQLPPDLQQFASFVNIAIVNNTGQMAKPMFHMTVQYQNCQGID